MKYLFFIFGLAVGIAQLFLLKKVVESLTAGKKDFLLYLFIKLVIYTGAIILLIIKFREFILMSGIGLAAGMIICAFINFIITLKTDNKSNNKGDDKA